MAENYATYKVSRKDLDGIRNTTLLPFDQGWEQPTPDEVRKLIEHAGRSAGKDKLTGSEVANLTGVNPRNVRKWSAPEDTSNYVKIPYAAWRLLLLHAGVVGMESLEAKAKTADRA